LERGFDGGGELGGVGFDGGFEAGEDLAVLAGEELGEVPFDVAALGGGEVLIEGDHVGTFDADLGEDGEGDVVVFGAEGFDFLVGAGFLAAEVVGGDADDDEALGFVLLIEGFEAGVLGGVATLGGDVDDEDDFAGVGFQRGGLPVDGFHGEFVDGFGGHGGECEGERGEGEFPHELEMPIGARGCRIVSRGASGGVTEWRRPRRLLYVAENIFDGGRRRAGAGGAGGGEREGARGADGGGDGGGFQRFPVSVVPDAA